MLQPVSGEPTASSRNKQLGGIMTITLVELRARLAAKYDEVTLIEILGLNSEDIVVAFSDLIEEKQDELTKGLEEDDEFSHQEYQAS